jgi:hypothetical protein
MNEHTQELQQFAEALLDVDRLKIVGELARGSNQPAVIAAQTGIDQPTVEAHLRLLAETNLIEVYEEPGGKAVYQLDEKALEEMSKRHFQWARQIAEPDQRVIGDQFTKTEAKYIRSFTDLNGIIKFLPKITQDAKLQALLKYARQDLEPGRVYTEKEFTEAVAPYSRDASSIRRYLIDYGFVERKVDGSAYWLKEGSDD